MHEFCPRMGLFWSIILSKIRLSVGPIFTVLTHEVSNRRSWCALLNGQKVVNQILHLAWSWSWSNFGQTWSTPVNFGKLWSNLVTIGQTFPNLKKCAPGHVLRTFWCIWATLGSNSARSGYLVLCVNTRGNLRGKNRVMTNTSTLLKHYPIKDWMWTLRLCQWPISLLD